MALSAAVNLQFRNTAGQSRYELVVVTAVQIYKGGLIGRVVSTGKARPCRNATTEVFAGIALSDKLGASDGSVSVTLVNDVEVLITTAAAVTIATMLTSKLYAVDDASVTTATTLGPEVGVGVQYVSSSSAWVKLRQQPIVVAS
jgi:hypothetical protein